MGFSQFFKVKAIYPKSNFLIFNWQLSKSETILLREACSLNVSFRVTLLFFGYR